MVRGTPEFSEGGNRKEGVDEREGESLEDFRKRIKRKYSESLTNPSGVGTDLRSNDAGEPKKELETESTDLEQFRQRINRKYGEDSFPHSEGQDEGRAGAYERLGDDRVDLPSRNPGGEPGKEGSDRGDKEGEPAGREARETNGSLVRRASAYMDSLALLIPRDSIPKHENRDDVFEVTIARESKPGEEFHLFMTHKPEYDRAYLNIKQLEAEKGEEFRVKRIERFGPQDFAEEYDENKPRGLENTQLSWKEDGIKMKVDGVEFELKDWKLRAQEGKAVLDAKLNDEEKNAVKIARGINDVDFRFARDHAEIKSMSETRDGLKISYERTHHDPYPHVRLLTIQEALRREGSEAMESPEHRIEFDAEGVRIDRKIRPSPDTIKVEFSEENARAAREYWSSADSPGEQDYHQGDIGEAVARLALEKSGFRLLPKHVSQPETGRIYAHESEKPGPDVIMYEDKEAEADLYLCEVKHWRESAKGLREAKEDIAGFASSEAKRTKLEKKIGATFRGGFAVELMWSNKDREGIIYIDYIEF